MFYVDIILVVIFALVCVLRKVLKDRKVISGRLFNLVFCDKTFLTLTDGSSHSFPGNDYNYNYTFKNGNHVAMQSFDPTDKNSSKGISFIENTQLLIVDTLLHEDKTPNMRFVRSVTIPNDAKVYIMGNGKFKTDQAIFGPCRNIVIGKDIVIGTDVVIDSKFVNGLADLPDYLKMRKLCLDIVKYDGTQLKYVPNELKDMEMCTYALENDRCALS